MEDLTEFYRDVLEGPYLHCLGEELEVGELVLEVKATNRRGLLPASILSGQPELLKQINDQWLREVVCKLVVTQNKKDKTPKYLAKYFIKSPKACVDDAEVRSNIKANDDKEVYLGDTFSAVDQTGVRGHPKGLVSKSLINRVDGLQRNSEWQDGHSEIKGTRLKLRLDRSFSPICPDEALNIPSSNFTGMLADCMDALVRRIFYKAKELDKKLLEAFSVDAMLHSGPIVEFQKASPTLDIEDKRSERKKRSADDMQGFETTVQSQDLVSKEFGDKTNNLASCHNHLPKKERPGLIYTLNTHGNKDIWKTAGKESPNQNLQITSKSGFCSDMVTEKSRLTSKQDGNKPSLMSSSKRIRFFIGRLFCCMPVFRPIEASAQ